MVTARPIRRDGPGNPTGIGGLVVRRYFRTVPIRRYRRRRRAVRSRPAGRPSRSSSFASWHAGETSEGPAPGPSLAGPGLFDMFVSNAAPEGARGE